MAKNKIIYPLSPASPISETPFYTERVQQVLTLPPVLRANATTTVTLGTATSMSPLPTDIKTPKYEHPQSDTPTAFDPRVDKGYLDCILQFGGWSVIHAGSGDVRLGARVVAADGLNAGSVLVNEGTVGVDWTRSVASTGSAFRARHVTIPEMDLTWGGIYVQLLYAISGSPTTKTVGYPFVELIPLQWRA